MLLTKKMAAMAGAAIVVASGCSSQTANQPAQGPPSFGEYRQSELQSERDEFISEHENRLDELNNEIGLVEVKLKHESKFVDEEQRADWSQELFELRQEKDRVSAELQRARNASEAEWSEMRGTLGGAIDTVEAGVAKIRDEVMGAFEGSDDTSTSESEGQGRIAADRALCPVGLTGVKAEVQKANGLVIVTLTTENPEAMPSLRAQAKKVAAKGEYRTAMVTPSSSAEETKTAQTEKTVGQAGETQQKQPTAGMETPGQALQVQTQVQKIDNGVRIVMKPRNKNQLDALHQQVEHDKDALADGRCERVDDE